MAETNTRQASRAPVTLKIKFKSETLDQFIERYSVDISHGGIFIRTKDPLAVGTSLKFEFQLKDATPLIGGEGTVVWTREHDPTRSGVSPGMGVRFDKLPSESQKVLDQVLARKSGAQPEPEEPEEDDDDSLGGDFVDTPTRVAPAALVDSLTNDYDDGDMTPLPKPMPFHGDMDDFSDEAFSESTKVASLDKILEQAKNAEEDESDYDEDQVFASTSAPPPAAKPVEESKPSADDYEDPFADLNEGDDEADDASDRAATVALEDSVSVDDSASEDSVSEGPVSDDAEEAAQAAVADVPADTPATEVAAEDSVVAETEPRPAAAPAKVSAEKAAVATPIAEVDQGSSMPWIAVAAVILLIGGVGGFWLLNNGKDDKDSKAAAPATDAKASQQAAKVPVKNVEPEQPKVPEPPPVKTIEVAVSTEPEGATIKVEGSDIEATSPATLALPEGKSAVLLVSHSEFLAQSLEVMADGTAVGPITLVAKPRILRFTSTPAGAKVFVNGQKLPGVTPLDVPFNARLARRPKLNIQYRLPRHKMWSKTVVSQEGFEASEENLMRTFDAPLEPLSAGRPAPQRKPTPRPEATGTGSDESDSGDTGSSDGTSEPNAATPDEPKDTAPTDETPKAEPPKQAPPKVDPPKDDTGDGEPTPDWMK